MYPFLARNVFAPGLDLWRGESTIKCLEELGGTQWWPRDRLLELQNDRLRKLMQHAYDNVPHYRRVFTERGLTPADIRTSEDLLKLPILTRTDVRNNFSELLARSFTKKGMVPCSTGGSTGEPLRFYRTKESISWGAAAKLRAYGWAGYRVGDTQALIWGSPIDTSSWESIQRKLVIFFKRALILNSWQLSEHSLTAFTERLRKFKPKLIIGYASAVYLLARFMEEREIRGIEPRAVSTQAEMLFAYQREVIERVFRCKVFDFYGNREFETLAVECPEHCGYHIATENIVLEFIRDGKPVSAGETGAILVTDLHNYGMPFIRYDCGDLGRPSEALCPCGRGLPLMDAIEGRITDVIVTADSKYIATPVLTLIFKDLPVDQYQVIQSQQGDIKVKIVPADAYCSDTANYILSAMRHYIGENTKIELDLVHSIPPTISGKKRIVISEVPIKFS